jgi:hypothetical protein
VIGPRTNVVETADGARLEFDVAGQGPAVAFLHPGLWDRRAWDDQFRLLATTYRACATTSGATLGPAVQSPVRHTRTSRTSCQ